MRRDRDLDAWEVFCLVAQSGSISKACETLNMDASAVSRLIKGLEESLGNLTLFDRTSRPLRLTLNGEIAYRYGREMLTQHQTMLDAFERDPLAMRGTIRVGLPPQVLQNFLLPLIVAFHQEYPDIYLSVHEYTASTPVNFDTRSGMLDLVMGYGADTTHDNIVQIYYGNGYLIPCASPLYLSRYGTPENPEDLIKHTGVIFQSPMRPPVRQLSKDGVTKTLVWGKEMAFDSASGALNATLYGVGIHPGIPSLHCWHDINAGKLVPVLKGWRGPDIKLYIYVRPEAAKQKRIQLFIERYRQYMDNLHEQCEQCLRPYLGELPMRVRAN